MKRQHVRNQGFQIAFDKRKEESERTTPWSSLDNIIKEVVVGIRAKNKGDQGGHVQNNMN
jgi:hypothetical protein